MPGRLLSGFVAVGLLATVSTAQARDLVYTPISPSFGGSPLNSSHLLGIANAQRTATSPRDKRNDLQNFAGGLSGSGSTTSEFDLFVRQLQGRLLSALASQVTDAIFGPQPQERGTVRLGAQSITFERTLDSIRLLISDSDAGTNTEIVVPLLVQQ